MEKLEWFFEELVGETLTLSTINGDGSATETGSLKSWTGTRFANVELLSGADRRLQPEEAIRAYFAAQVDSTSSKSLPETIKALAVKLLKRMQDHKSQRSNQRKSTKKEVKAQGVFKKRVRLERQRESQYGEMLEECKDIHTITSLDQKIKKSELRMKEAQDKLAELEAQGNKFFSSMDDLIAFFKEMGVVVNQQALSRWSRGVGLGKVGRKPAFDPAAEKKADGSHPVQRCNGTTNGPKSYTRASK